MPRRQADVQGNFISEWFGHRIFPKVAKSKQSCADQQSEACPFLSSIKGGQQSCVKPLASRGVCTISSSSNGPRQDWVVCPYRAFDRRFFEMIASRLYSVVPGQSLLAFPAPSAERPEIRRVIETEIARGSRVLVYFDVKIGGEISLSATSRSPEMAFDVTFVSLEGQPGAYSLGKFAIVEIQTMDFHGSYRKAVQNLQHGLRLHRHRFPAVLQRNLHWTGEGVEGPNIANVFKRTFYQMMFKFSFGQSSACAGTALAIPAAVWDSWQRFLGGPELAAHRDGTYRLVGRADKSSTKVPAWIYVFDLDSKSARTPSPMRIQRIIGTTADALAHYALDEAPAAASAHLMSPSGIYQTLARRLQDYWPELILRMSDAPA